ncbi:MAG: hypothetical protein JWO13_1569 [Acidobacteriales bacterium]|nr:hypothetical protein [Terriglobales bacterium]
MKSRNSFTRALAVLLLASLSGITNIAQAQQTTSATPATPQDQNQAPATGAQNPPATPGDLPNAPSTNSTQTQDQTRTPATPTTVIFPGGTDVAPAQQTQTGKEQPLGAAAAEKGVTRGGAASRPAGTAIAGTKQRQSRSLLIKLGAMAAAGAALGTVYALTKGTGSVPPGAVH